MIFIHQPRSGEYPVQPLSLKIINRQKMDVVKFMTTYFEKLYFLPQENGIINLIQMKFSTGKAFTNFHSTLQRTQICNGSSIKLSTGYLQQTTYYIK